MPATLSRRDLLIASALVGFAGPALADDPAPQAEAPQPAVPEATAAPAGFSPALGSPKPFSFDALVERMKAAAGRPYEPDPVRAGVILSQMHEDDHLLIHPRGDHTFAVPGTAVPVQFFHLSRRFQQPVEIYLVEGDKARQVLYSPDYFDEPADGPARELPPDIGFAGFRLMNDGLATDWLSFIGASYFRSEGELHQYGLSARAVAVNTALGKPEEFPRFTRFLLAPPASPDALMTIYGQLDGPSLTGATRMDVKRDKGVVMTVAVRLFAREDIQRLGIAPLTSMYWYSETNRRSSPDWRPEVHDSDGLAMWTGGGERIWRPLNDPGQLAISSFADDNMRGFGLLQRDRNFENYQDSLFHYERRADAWIEPLSNWGRGVVQLVEIPTDTEVTDNIVAYWVNEGAVEKGAALAADYRLYWTAAEPFGGPDAHVVATRAGAGGPVGSPARTGYVRFVVDFEGGRLAGLDAATAVTASIAASRGQVSNVEVSPVSGTARWRASFEITVDGTDPVDLRLFLKQGDMALSETWLYQYLPAQLP